MEKILCFFVTALACGALQAQLPAFPEAEGFGRYALGARGVENPTVYHVTNLNDAGEGSLRDAVSQPGRIVVFDTCGVIRIKDRIIFSGSSYVAGHTAPGDGITVYGNGISVSGANNIIIRYLRIHMGAGGQSGKDAVALANGENMCFDHLSIAWGRDENFSVNWDGKGALPSNITIQNSIIAQGLVSHSAGGLIQTEGGVSIIGCLYVDNNTRNPKVKGLNQFINNVVYNWGGAQGYILADSDGPSWGWMEGNYFISGPKSGALPFQRARENFQLYTGNNNNLVDGNRDGVLNGAPTSDEDYANSHGGSPPTIVTSIDDFSASRCATCADIPKPHPQLAGGMLTPDEALIRVVALAGASLPVRSMLDAFLIDELTSYGAKGAHISGEAQNGLYGVVGPVSSGAKANDSDNDGIPDAWEDSNGLDKNNPSDALEISPSGYLNVERYLNSIAAPTGKPYLRRAFDLKMTARTKYSIDLAWKNQEPEADALTLQISHDGLSFTELSTLEAGTEAYSVTGLSEETFYAFRVVTKKSGFPDATSEDFRVSTVGDPAAPLACTDPTPAQGDTLKLYENLLFSWKNETGTWSQPVTYRVFFGTESSALAPLHRTPLSKASFAYSPVEPLTPGVAYYWRVDAMNAQDTVQSQVWRFVTGTAQMAYADVGKDYVSGTSLAGLATSKSNVLISNAFNGPYVIFQGTDNELTITLEGGAAAKQTDGSYLPQSAGSIAIFDLNGDEHYLEASATGGADTAKRKIVEVTINGTSGNVSSPAAPILLYSDSVPFDPTGIRDFEQVELPPARAGEPAITLKTPEGCRSFRIYRKIALTQHGDLYCIDPQGEITLANSESQRIPYLGVLLEATAAPKTGNSNDDDTPTAAPKHTLAALACYGNAVHNPASAVVSIYSIAGVLLMQSSRRVISVAHLPVGIYIAATATGEVIKFVRAER
jgi:pectate lyase